MNTNVKKATVIGCNGYIGKHISSFLIDKGWNVFGYDKSEKPLVPIKKYLPIDLLEKAQVNKIETNVDFIFYFSGITGTVNGYEDYETYIKINEIGLLHLCLLYTSPSPRDRQKSRMPSSA